MWCVHTNLYDGFIETMSAFNLSQMVREPTRQGNILNFVPNHQAYLSKLGLVWLIILL